ncbi:MAG: (d)CMP kinase, partial [Candidatus Cloacimonetes bacterium]|nr:(d)CMP kinase [Candidatus Cloacimonadota bacterium]
AALQAGIEHSDTDNLNKILENIDISIEYSPDGNRVLLNNIDVTTRIREEDISRLSSDISVQRPVREKMVALQRKMGEKGGVIMDGRDIGTVVFPNAELKFFMIATAEERARRRCEELQNKGKPACYETVLKEMQERDLQDSTRALAPLKPAEDSICIDTTSLSIEEQVEVLYNYVSAKLTKGNN